MNLHKCMFFHQPPRGQKQEAEIHSLFNVADYLFMANKR